VPDPTIAPTGSSATGPATQTTLVVPENHSMVALLGSGMSCCDCMKTSWPATFWCAGNEITLTGVPSDNAFAMRFFEELLALLEPARRSPRTRCAAPSAS